MCVAAAVCARQCRGRGTDARDCQGEGCGWSSSRKLILFLSSRKNRCASPHRVQTPRASASAMGKPSGEERSAKAKEWVDETFVETAPGEDAPHVMNPETREGTDAAPNDDGEETHDEAPCSSEPPQPAGPHSAWPEAKTRREKREKRGEKQQSSGGKRVTFATTGGSGTDGESGSGDEGRDVTFSLDEKDNKRKQKHATDEQATTWTSTALWVLATLLQILLDIAISLTPSIKSRQRRYSISDDVRRRKAAMAKAAAMRGEPANKERKPGAERVRNGKEQNQGSFFDGDRSQPGRRGTAGARQRALDRNDVPPELRGQISAKQWRREVQNFHEEQVLAQQAKDRAGRAIR